MASPDLYQSRSRDSLVDADPDLTRKRQKLNGQHAQSSSPSISDSLVIEALSPSEDGGDAAMVTTIRPEEGDDDADASEDDRDLSVHSIESTKRRDQSRRRSAVEMRQHFDLALKENAYISPHRFQALTELLTYHVEAVTTRPHLQPSDLDIFAELGRTIAALLDWDDLIDQDSIDRFGRRELGDLCSDFDRALTVGAVHIVARLPDLLESSSSCEDLNPRRPPQREGLLCYVRILAQLLNGPATTALSWMQRYLRMRSDALQRPLQLYSLENEDIARSLSRLTHVLLRRHQESYDACFAIDAAINAFRRLHAVPIQDVRYMMELIHDSLLPFIHHRHPSTLPRGFHRAALEAARDLLTRILEPSQDHEFEELYNRFIKSECDALIPPSADGLCWRDAITFASQGDRATAKQLLFSAWYLQALKVLVFSDIMDARGQGIAMLGSYLKGIWDDYRVEHEGATHPVLEFAARYLRVNEFTNHIFGPHSRAHLILHSPSIVGFLAATQHFTTLDADVIWRACTNSVEADFVKACLMVLNDVLNYLDWKSLVHIGNKYTCTPPQRLGKDAPDVLRSLFARLAAQSVPQGADLDRLAVTRLGIDIIAAQDQYEPNPTSIALQGIAASEILLIARSSMSVADRKHTLEHWAHSCARNIDLSPAAIEVPLMFLRSIKDATLHAPLQSMFDLDMMLTELETFVDYHRTIANSQSSSTVLILRSRMEIILRVMALMRVKPGAHDAVSRVFRCCFGDSAISMIARDCAWSLLKTLIEHREADWASPFLEKFASWILVTKVPQIPAQYATVTLIDHLETAITKDLRERTDPFDTDLLRVGLWQKLVDIATHPWCPQVHAHATKLIGYYLFKYPVLDGAHAWSMTSILRCRADFVHERVEHIVRACEQQPGHAIVPGIELLSAILAMSKEAERLSEQDGEPDKRKDSVHPSETAPLHLRIHAGSVQKTVSIGEVAMLSWEGLSTRISAITGATKNRIEVEGHENDPHSPADTLAADLVPPTATVIDVFPQFLSGDDFSDLLTNHNVIEDELLKDYDRLEALLEMPGEIAAKMFALMREMRPPAALRRRVANMIATAEVDCPVQMPWKTAMVIFTLDNHLKDLSKLHIEDRDFLSYGGLLLTSVAIDRERRFTPVLCRRMLDTLNTFVHGLATRHISLTVEAPARVVDGLLDLILNAIESSWESLPEREERQRIAALAYEVLLGLAQCHPLVKSSFMSNDRVAKLQARLHFDESLGGVLSRFRALCTEVYHDDDLAKFHVDLMLSLLPQAPSPGLGVGGLLESALHIFSSVPIWTPEESRIHAHIDLLATELCNYHHIENVDLPIADHGMLGLLRLLFHMIEALKGSELPASLSGLPTKLIEKFLFPYPADGEARPLLDDETRRLAFGLVKSTCASTKAFADAMHAFSDSLRSIGTFIRSHSYSAGPIRAAYSCCGLDNLGMTCYMNSLIQQLFANVHFRKFVFEVRIEDAAKQTCLAQLQFLFARMQNQSVCSIKPRELAEALEIRTKSQEDVHGFYEDFLDRLEREMPEDRSKQALAKFYTGKLVSQIKGACGHVSTCVEPFVDLQVLVKNKARLEDSLEEFVQGEPLEGANQYKCLACDPSGDGVLVDAMKRACMAELPDNLTFCLKRFSYESMLGVDDKVNDHFEFPQSIDMSPYKLARLDGRQDEVEPDVFELVGVIVHQGNLQFGHYWSYVLSRNMPHPQSHVWTRFEDSNTRHLSNGLQEALPECFGRPGRTDNAYVLFYQRTSALNEPISVLDLVHAPPSSTSQSLPPRVQLPAVLQSSIHKENYARHAINHVCADDLVDLLKWCFTDFLPAAESRIVACRNGQPAHAEETQEDVFDAVSGQMLAEAAVSMAMSCVNIAKFTRLRQAVLSAVKERPILSRYFLSHLCQTAEWEQFFAGGRRTFHWNKLEGLIQECFVRLRKWDMERYLSIVQQLVSRLSSLSTNTQAECETMIDWTAYVDFLGWMAAHGPEETKLLLGADILSWALRVLCSPWIPEFLELYPYAKHVMEKRPEQVSSLYRFVRQVLEGADVQFESATQAIRVDQVCLTPEDTDIIFNNSQQPELLWMRSARFADCTKSDGFAPAMLMLLLMKNAPFSATTISKSLEALVEYEEEPVTHVLYLLKHYCADRMQAGDPRAAARALSWVTKAVHRWQSSDEVFLEFVAEAMTVAPEAVVDEVTLWFAHFLDPDRSVKDPQVRRQAAKCLSDDIFVRARGSDSAQLEKRRVAAACRMTVQVAAILQSAFASRRPPTAFEPLISVGTALRAYMRSIKEATRLGSQWLDDSAKQALTDSVRSLGILLTSFSQWQTLYPDEYTSSDENAAAHGGGTEREVVDNDEDDAMIIGADA